MELTTRARKHLEEHFAKQVDAMEGHREAIDRLLALYAKKGLLPGVVALPTV